MFFKDQEVFKQKAFLKKILVFVLGIVFYSSFCLFLNMNLFLQLLINGLIAGSIYALVSSGFSVIYSTNKFVHFAHGATIAVSAYVLYYFFSALSLNFYFSVVLAVLFGGFFGFAVNKLFYEQLRLRKASGLILLIASVALLTLFEALILLFFGADVKTINFIKVEKGLEFFGAIITPLQIVIIFSALILLVLLFVFMKHTKLGKAMRAVSDNKDVAEIVGISSRRIFAWSFVIGSLIAGAAGVLVALEQNLEPTMGTSLMIKGFTGAIIGGVGSVPGAILGAFLLGFAENFGIWFLPSGYKDAIAFVILFIFLLFRPQGILGIKKVLGN
jgi:branched-subunit amino acid ABC-type transport system permease component